MARAVYDYAGTGNGTELLFSKGDEIVILQKHESGWWEGELNGNIGWFPAEFVEEVVIVSSFFVLFKSSNVIFIYLF